MAGTIVAGGLYAVTTVTTVTGGVIGYGVGTVGKIVWNELTAANLALLPVEKVFEGPASVVEPDVASVFSDATEFVTAASSSLESLDPDVTDGGGVGDVLPLLGGGVGCKIGKDVGQAFSDGVAKAVKVSAVAIAIGAGVVVTGAFLHNISQQRSFNVIIVNATGRNVEFNGTHFGWRGGEIVYPEGNTIPPNLAAVVTFKGTPGYYRGAISWKMMHPRGNRAWHIVNTSPWIGVDKFGVRALGLDWISEAYDSVHS